MEFASKIGPVKLHLYQAFCLDIRKETQGEKNSKLKEVTENSRSNQNKVGLCLYIFGDFYVKIKRLRSKTSENRSKLKKNLNTQGKNSKSRHF